MPVKKRAQAKAAETTAAFAERYGVLNEGQKRAVDTVEGPVMVVAGPGTGKTEVVALRVANILKKTHARPSNILCLTFSVSGATAMRERLRALMGADAYGVTIRNFHGFCADLIAENPLVFDAWSAMELISDVEKYRTVNKIIDQLSPDLELVNPKMPHARTKDILSRISDLKREGVTDREKLLAIADTYERTLAGKSKEGTKAHEKNLLTARKFRDFLHIFFLYEEQLRSSQRFDFDDMILFTIQALETEDWLLASLQERYQYILVDEFQDTNGAQYRLVDLLTTPRTPEDKPNLFVVGDDDQAIYRFQGANLKNILNFHERFPAAPVIPLTVSYRCTQRILDAAGPLIAQNSERLVGRIPGLKKDLTAGGLKDGPEPKLLFSPSDASEPWVIADMLGEKMQSGIPPEEIAVFCQTNAEVLRLYEVFAARDIPVSVSGKADLLAHPFVTQAMAILRAVVNPHTDSALSAALACECFGCHAADISRIALRAREEKTNMLLILLALDAEEGMQLTKRSELLAARDVLLDLHEKEKTRTVTETLEALFKTSGLLALARGEQGNTFDAVRFAALQEFFNWVKERAFENQTFTLESLLSDLSLFDNPDYPELRLTFNIPHLVEKGVALMTAHQSKGLEFDTVILSNFREGHWDKRRNPSSLSIPEDLLFGWEKEQKSYERNQDERRLTYVAMTRARRELLFVCPKDLTTGDKMRSVSPSGFFAEAGKLPEEIRELKDPSSAALLLYEPVRNLDAEMRAYLRDRLKDYALSVTALNHFLEDPKMFLELDLLQTPQAKESSLVYGNAVHDALKKWGLSVLEGKPMSEEAFLAAFRAYMESREILTDKERARLTKAGEDALPRYYRERLGVGCPLVHKVEYAVTTRFEDIPLKGKIDRIDLLAPDSAEVAVIDYKTGRPKTEHEIRDEKDYFRQLVFYALLLQEKGAFLEPKQFILDFIGEKAEHPVARPFVISGDELKELQEIVKAVWAKISNLDFSPL